MQQNIEKTQLFYEYYKQWIDVYKKGAIREATMAKYLMTQKWVEKLAPELKVSELTRTAYQKLLNVESRKSLFMDSDILMLRFYYLLVFRLLVWPDV